MNSQHVRGGGLLLQRFAQLVEQPDIFYGDHGLIGEGRHQLDLFRRKWVRHALADEDHPYHVSFAQQWRADRGAVARHLLCLAPGIIGISKYVGDVNHLCFHCGSPGYAASIDWDLQGLEKISDPRVDIGCMAVAGGPS